MKTFGVLLLDVFEFGWVLKKNDLGVIIFPDVFLSLRWWWVSFGIKFEILLVLEKSDVLWLTCEIDDVTPVASLLVDEDAHLSCAKAAESIFLDN